MVTLAQRIEELRTARGLSRPALAAALGFPRTAIEKFETGRQTPTQDQQNKLASYFGVSLFYLRGETNDTTQMSDWMDGAFLDEPAPVPAPRRGADKKTSVWNSLVLKDYIDQNVVKYNVKDGKFDLLAAEQSLYRTATSSTGLTFSTKTEGWTIENGKLKCTIDPTGTIYEKVVTVTVAYKHDWGTTSFDFTIEVIRNAKP